MLDFARITVPPPKRPPPDPNSGQPAPEAALGSDAPPASDSVASASPPKPPKRRRRRRIFRRFYVTAAMRRYAEVLCAPDCPATEIERCERARIGIRRVNAWRRQYRDNDFENWLQNEIRLILSRRMVDVWNELHRLVKKGHFQAAKLLVQHCPTSSPTPWKR
jgi:hypothetical protein